MGSPSFLAVPISVVIPEVLAAPASIPLSVHLPQKRAVRRDQAEGGPNNFPPPSAVKKFSLRTVRCAIRPMATVQLLRATRRWLDRRLLMAVRVAQRWLC